MLTYAEAAARLGVSKRTVHSYISKGFLRNTLRNGKKLLHTSDVEELAESLGTDLPALTRRTVLELTNRINKLEQQMAVAQEMWKTFGVQEKPLRPTPQEAVSLHRAVTQYLTVEKYQVKELESWAPLLMQIDEKTLEVVGEAVRTVKPWEPFHQLATRMLDFVTDSKETKNSLQLQALRTQLERARKRVREAALFWFETGRGTVPAHLFKSLDTPKEDLLRALASKS